MKTRRRVQAFVDCLILVAFSALLVWPLFRLEYLNNWGSIESTFIADARMLIGNFPHPGWQPLWYCGTRFDFIYPPALRYGTAIIAMLAGVSTARAYHLFIAIFYVLGIPAVYWLVYAGTRRRLAAFGASVATALLSPSFLLLPGIRHDSPFWIPQRLHVLMNYGEGPHVSAVCVLPAALALCFMALRKWNPVTLGAAALLCALAVAINFYAATSLAILFPVMAWSVFAGERRVAVLVRALAIAALAWGLCAVWLTPAYVSITILNLRWVSHPGNVWSMVAAAALALAFGVISLRFADGPRREWPTFVWGAALFLTLDVLGFFYFGFRIMGEPHRLIPELDLALILLFALAAEWAVRRRPLRMVAAIAILLAFLPSYRYLSHAWTPFEAASAPRQSYEYLIANWTDTHLHGLRVLPSGSVRFWFDAWSDNQQPDGGSLQGMMNQTIPAATWQILTGSDPHLSVLWLKALGTDAVIVPDKQSRDLYRDYAVPQKFRGALPALFDDGHGTVIYKIPRLYPGIARVIYTDALSGMTPITAGDDVAALTKYASIVEDPRQTLSTVTWSGFDHADIHATLASRQSVLFQETYDSGWRADAGGRALAIHREPVMGFMLIDAPEGEQTIHLHFEAMASNHAGIFCFGVASGILCVLLATGLFTTRRGTRDSGPPAVPFAS